MILVTLGTQDKKFYRLLDAIQKEIDSGLIKDTVVVQAGYSKNYKSEDMQIFDLIPIDDFDKLVKKCDILITHGGVGSIITGLRYGKKIIAVPRLKKYKEHTNDHQVQIIDNFVNDGYILKMEEKDNLSDVLNKLRKFNPKKYENNNNNFVKLVDKEIEKYIK